MKMHWILGDTWTVSYFTREITQGTAIPVQAGVVLKSSSFLKWSDSSIQAFKRFNTKPIQGQT